MFWLSIVLLSVGALLIKLGAMSVLLVVMGTALKVSLFVIAVLAGLLVWRRYKCRRFRRLP